jgi:hypothetical protein
MPDNQQQDLAQQVQNMRTLQKKLLTQLKKYGETKLWKDLADARKLLRSSQLQEAVIDDMLSDILEA